MILLDIELFSSILVLKHMSKLQLHISATLLEAINIAAAKDLRTQRAFVTKILQEHPLIRECLPKSLCEPTVKTVAPQCDTVAPLATPGYIKRAVASGLAPAPSFSPVGPVTLPDGTVCDDPYGLNDEPAPRS